MYICVQCRHQMICDKNGVGANYGHGHVYPADRFICKHCGMMILATNDRPIHDPAYNTQEEYLNMGNQDCDVRRGILVYDKHPMLAEKDKEIERLRRQAETYLDMYTKACGWKDGIVKEDSDGIVVVCGEWGGERLVR